MLYNMPWPTLCTVLVLFILQTRSRYRMNTSQTSTSDTAAIAIAICSSHSVNLTVEVNEANLDCIILDLYSFFGLFIVIVGTIGHILSILVIASQRSFRVQSFGVYIIALSLAGLLALYTGLLRWVIQGYTDWDLDLKSLSDVSCFGLTILTYFSLHLIAWLQATIALDRVFHVVLPIWRPHFYSRRCRWKHGLVIVSVEAVAAIFINSFLLLVLDFDKDLEPNCGYKDLSVGTTWSTVDLINFSILPSAIIIVCNVIIVVAIARSHVHSENENERVNRTRRSLTVMLMMVNLTFILTTLPISIVQVINGEGFTDSGTMKLHLARTVCSLVQYLGTACLFIIYCLSGSKFRNTIKRWVTRSPITNTKLESKTSVFEMSQQGHA